MYFLGVDGGGTKTQVLITDEHKNILSMSKVGPTNVRNLDEDTLLRTLNEGIRLAVSGMKLKDLEIDFACFGVAGLDTLRDYEVLNRAVEKIAAARFLTKPTVLNDAVCAFRRGTDKKYGIAVVAGTGSNCYGKNLKGEEVYVGGLGHVLSDEGGGYYIGVKALQAAAKSYDGRIEKSLLETLIYEHFGAFDMREVILKVHDKDFGKHDVATLAVLCEKASTEGDFQAGKILQEAGSELSLMALTCAKRLAMLGTDMEIICSGGSFNNARGPLRKTFEEKTKRVATRAKIIYPVSEPAMGAVLIALDRYKTKRIL
ncbi:hypothetical protein HY419_01010 [candidate division WWE3 bacterium]|nr:hypothetical protein [candidate division WWE3 bacterium]